MEEDFTYEIHIFGHYQDGPLVELANLGKFDVEEHGVAAARKTMERLSQPGWEMWIETFLYSGKQLYASWNHLEEE